MSDTPSIRHLSIEEAREIDGLAALPATPAPGTRVFVLDREGAPRAVAILDLHGGPTEPDDPCLLIESCGDAASRARPVDPVTEVAPLAQAALDAARADGHARVTTGCDPMNLARLRALEGLGFAATGRQPYFPLGGDQVTYVMGYADASGAVMDLAISLGG